MSTNLAKTCLAIAGLATAWVATPAQAQVVQETVDGTATATLDPTQAVTNPQFLYVSNTSIGDPLPGNISLPTANFAAGVNVPSAFSFQASNEIFTVPIFPFPELPGSVSFLLVGLSPDGDLVAALDATVAANAITGNTAFDTLFPVAGNEAALISALQNPGPAADTNLTNFAGSLSPLGSGNPNAPSYTFNLTPTPYALTLVEFNHDTGGAPINSAIGSLAGELITQPIPEPASLAILAPAMLALLHRRRRA